MSEIRVKLSEENHQKLRMLCVLYRKTQDEVVNMLLKRARVPGEKLEFIVADEEPTIAKSSPKEIKGEVEFLFDDSA